MMEKSMPTDLVGVDPLLVSDISAAGNWYIVNVHKTMQPTRSNTLTD